KYWDDWRRECDLADIIIANSEWSKSLLARDGVNENKIRVVPLAMEQNRATFASHSKVPDEFNQDRPLHVLCLGQINLRKGIVPLIGAFQKLQHAHVHLHLVGNGPLFPWVKSQNLPNVTCYGAVGREESFQSYRNADIFILPSFSDGFAITQLEAQIAGLPIIASNNCGSVVQNQHNGLLLDEVSAEAIADAVTSCLNNPARISEWMKNSKLEARFTLEGLKDELQKISIDLSDN
ncbi:MAG: glycosyltransferase family 4 protein, partial [Verrucomicrobiota bacterium]